MKKYKFKIDGNPYEVNIKNLEDTTAEVEVNGVTYTVEFEKTTQISKTPRLVRPTVPPSTESTETLKKTAKPTDFKGAGLVKSPLPGVILRVNCKEGQTVKMGDNLIVLEAMKMENEIHADKEGVIKSIKVKEGDSVLEGDVLIEIGA